MVLKLPSDKKKKPFKALKFVVLCDKLFAIKKVVRNGEYEITNKSVICENFNPIPTPRLTVHTLHSSAGKKYKAWKEKIFHEFINQIGKKPISFFDNKQKYLIFVRAYFKDKRKGDSNNINKGIEDAIFRKPLNDNNVITHFKDYEDKENPRVEIIIVHDTIKMLEAGTKWLGNAEYKIENFK